MDINNNNTGFYNIFDNTSDIENTNDEDDINIMNLYNGGRFDNRGYNNYMYDYDRRFDRHYDRRYYQYPYCDRYGRCQNPIWWLFWPFFFF
mgnify:CR=1 FL=1